MRRCKPAPPRCQKPGKPCCADCPDEACQDRCQNDPELCGCWEDGPLPRKWEPPIKLDRAEIFRLHEKGLPRREIAAQLGCSVSGVGRVLNGEGGGGHGKA